MASSDKWCSWDFWIYQENVRLSLGLGLPCLYAKALHLPVLSLHLHLCLQWRTGQGSEVCDSSFNSCPKSWLQIKLKISSQGKMAALPVLNIHYLERGLLSHAPRPKAAFKISCKPPCQMHNSKLENMNHVHVWNLWQLNIQMHGESHQVYLSTCSDPIQGA